MKKITVILFLLMVFFASIINAENVKANVDDNYILIILNKNPYDGSDITWNALRLAKKLNSLKKNVKIFLINDSVDLARDAAKKPENYDIDLVAMLKSLIKSGVEVKACSTCMARCGIYKNKPYFSKNLEGHMDNLAAWILSASKVISF
jgi:uncharacterized protein involved in oxidation of intracellular sulfur